MKKVKHNRTRFCASKEENKRINEFLYKFELKRKTWIDYKQRKLKV